jgi:CheY-like chemotaxis protein
LALAWISNPVRRFNNGSEAMAYLSHAAVAAAIGPAVPSIILLDIKLPGNSGFEILKYIKTCPAFDKSLKIVLSQLDDTRSIKEAYALGANSFLTKPLKQSELADLIVTFPGYWLIAGKPGTGTHPFHSPNPMH